MKNRFSTLLVVLVLLGRWAYPQVSLDTLLRIVEDQNPELNAALHRYEAEALSFRVGNAPPNPELEYGRMWSSPKDVGPRVDFSITQSIDFPTVYTSRSKLRKIGTAQAGLLLESVRQDVLAEARKRWTEAVYLNNKMNMLEARLRNAKLVGEGYRKKYETGEANQLERNQALLKVTMLSNEYNIVVAALENNRNELKRLAGGEEIIIDDTLLSPPADIDLDTILAAFSEGPTTRWYKSEVEKKEREKDLVFNTKLPKLMAGYYTESILGVDLRGVKAGLTIPLWGNANAVNQAKAATMFAESDAWRYQTEERTRIENLYGKWTALRTQVGNLMEAVYDIDNEALLVRSLQTGDISLTQYFYDSDFFFQSRLMLIESWKDMMQLEAEMMKIYY